MKYRSIDRRLTKRVFIHGGLWSNMNVPQIHIGYDEGCEYIGFSYGNEGCDAVFGVDLNLSGTRFGTWFGEWCWRRYRRREQRLIGAGNDH